MPIVVSNGATAILTGITGTAMSDAFTVTAAGTYTFTAVKSGNFAVLTFILQAVHGFQNQTIGTWNAAASPTFSFALVPGAVYRLTCSSFAGGSASVSVRGSNGGISPVPTKIATFPVNDWTPIVAPIDCNYYFIITNQDGSALQRGSDPNDSGSQYTIPAGESFALIVPVNGNSPRFHAGDTVTYLKSTGGNGPVIVEFYL